MESYSELEVIESLEIAGFIEEIKLVVIDDVRKHIGTQKVFDDITLVVIKQK